jgi:MFS family permease
VAARGAPLAPAVAAFLVFLASGAVLVLEILGLRLLAPYVGLTLESTTAIIGVTLAGIAAGAALGGRAADRLSPRPLLAGLLMAGGVLTLLATAIVRWIGPAAQDAGIGILGVALVALLPPAAVLSAVTPCVARLQLQDLSASGTIVGRLSAWATAGALSGTFVTGFVLVPLLPASTSLLVVGATLVLTGLAVGIGTAGQTSGQAAAVTVLALVSGLTTLAAAAPCHAETTYHCARVKADPNRSSGRELVLEDLSHSYVDLDDPLHLEFDYTRWIGDAIDGLGPERAPLDAVFVGGGGFTLPRYLAATRPGSRSRVLEVDGELVDLARERLGLRTSEHLRVTVGDARLTLRDMPTGSVDLVVGDAFSSHAVPWHLATAEWVADIRRVLRPAGLYAVNVIDEPPLNLMRAQAATLLDAFADVRLVARPGPAGGNLVLLASDRPLGARVGSTARGARIFERDALSRLAAGADVLRDDRAPADQLLSARH